jgi:hypothetical protein
VDEKKATRLAERLGAERVEKLPHRPKGLPLGLLQLRAQVHDRLRSSGGRPTDPSWTVSRQVPFKPQTWEQLQRGAEELGTSERRVGAAQLAAMLLEREMGTESARSSSLESLRSLGPVNLSRAADVTGITYRQLDHWCRRRALHLEKRGRQRMLGPDGLVQAVAMARLARLGDKAKELAPELAHVDLSKHFLVIDFEGEGSIRSIDSLQKLHDEMAVVIDLEEIRKALLGRLEAGNQEQDSGQSSTEHEKSTAV